MATQSNVDLNLNNAWFNTGAVKNGLKPTKPTTILFVPSGFSFSAADMLTSSSFTTAVNSLTTNATRSQRGFAIMSIDDLKNSTKKTATDDTGTYQLQVTQYPQKWDFIVRGTQDNYANYQQMAMMSNMQGYGFYFIDASGNVFGAPYATDGSLPCFSLQQFFVESWDVAMPDKTAHYPASISFLSAQEFIYAGYYACPTLNANALIGLQNVTLYQPPSAAVTAIITANSGSATTDIAVIGKMGGGQYSTTDFFKEYGTLLTKACFVAKDLTAGTTLTISSMVFSSIVVSGIPYYYGYAVLSAAPTSGHVVQLSLASPATVQGIIATWVVTEVVQLGTDGSNCCVKTF